MPAKAVVKIQKTAGMNRIRQAGDAALGFCRNELIEDMNRYVPVSGGDSQDGGGGDLRQSAILHSDQEAEDGRLTIRWDEPYAQYQHGGLVMKGRPGQRSYGPEKLNYTSAMARAQWEKYAEQQHGDDWARQIDAAMGLFF